MRSGRRWIGVTGSAAALALVLAGCGRGSDAEAQRDEATTTTSTSAPTLQPSGTEIGEGLVVPEGARLAGVAFPQVGDEPGGRPSWEAHLVVGDDPFVAWDDLAGQLRVLHPDAPFPGSADSCAWWWAERIEEDGRVVTLDGSEADGDGESSESDAVDRQRVTAEAPPGTLAGVECYASAIYDTDAGFERAGLRLQAGADRYASLTIEVRPESLAPEVRTTSQLSGLRSQVSSSGEAPPPTLDAVPDGAAALIPPSLPTPSVEAGDPFGSEVNCFAGDGYTRTLLPADATWVADIGFGDVSVLAVDDPRAVLEALRAQFEAGGADESSGIETVELDDGAAILSYSHSVSAGGGGCSVRSSPDGGFLLISRYAD